jgi:hypothetical protein
MLTIYLHYVVWAFLNPYLLSEVHLHANAKEAFNKVLQKNGSYFNRLCPSFNKFYRFFLKFKSIFLHPPPPPQWRT